MVKEETIEPQKVQQPTERKEKKESIAGIGYTQRPLNQRIQVGNTYLDSVKATKTGQTITDTTLTEITGYTFSKTGIYKFENTNSIIIPITGTYIINAAFDWSDNITQGIHYILLNGDVILTQVQDNLSAFQNVFLMSVENLSKGDIITSKVFQESGSNKDVTAKVSITKIS